MNGGTQNGSETGDGVISTTIINRKGFDLPTTGGFGTLLFSGIGVLLVVAGVGVLLSLKRRTAPDAPAARQNNVTIHQ